MTTHTTKPVAQYTSFGALDIRVGRIVKVEESKTTKPTYRMTIDFGEPIGQRVSCGAYKNYTQEFLTGRQIVAIVNLGTKKMGPEISEVLVLGVPNAKGETIFLMPEQDVALGAEVF